MRMTETTSKKQLRYWQINLLIWATWILPGNWMLRRYRRNAGLEALSEVCSYLDCLVGFRTDTSNIRPLAYYGRLGQLNSTEVREIGEIGSTRRPHFMTIASPLHHPQVKTVEINVLSQLHLGDQLRWPCWSKVLQPLAFPFTDTSRTTKNLHACHWNAQNDTQVPRGLHWLLGLPQVLQEPLYRMQGGRPCLWTLPRPPHNHLL